jgi:hypothetical protein
VRRYIFFQLDSCSAGSIAAPRWELGARVEAWLKANNSSRVNRASKSPHYDLQRSRKTQESSNPLKKKNEQRLAAYIVISLFDRHSEAPALENYRFLTPWRRIKNPLSIGLSRERFFSGFLTPLP